MVENITTRTVTLTRAAHAADMPVRTLRLTALAVPPLGAAGRMSGAWRRYSALDCVRLAVVGRLLEFGIGLAAAVEVLEAGVDRHVTGLALCGVDLPASFLQSRLDGVTLHVVPGRAGLDVYAAPRRLAPKPAPAALILDIGFIADDVFTALDAQTSTVAATPGRSTGGRAGAAAGAPIPSNLNRAGGTPAMESAQ